MRGFHHQIRNCAHRRAMPAVSNRCWQAIVALLVLCSADAVQAAPPGPRPPQPNAARPTMVKRIASTPASSSTEATSSASARDEAIRAIPWKQMSPNNRRTSQSVIKNASIYRRLPTRVIDCDPDMFTFLIQHPEVVVDVWRLMGVSQVALNKSPDGGYHGTDGAGTTGTVRYLFGHWGDDAQNIAIVFADGSYQGSPFVTRLDARSVMLVRSAAVRETNGRHYVTVRMDSFVQIDQMGIELVAKTVQPWINKTADRNLIETLTFVSNFSRTAEKNPAGMQRLATRLSALDAPTRDEFVTLCYRTAERYANRDQSNPTGALLAHRNIVALDK